MFKGSEQKLKIWAKVQGVLLTALAVLIGLVLFLLLAQASDGVWGILCSAVTGGLVGFVLWVVSMISAWMLYSFAELVEAQKYSSAMLYDICEKLDALAPPEAEAETEAEPSAEDE